VGAGGTGEAPRELTSLGDRRSPMAGVRPRVCRRGTTSSIGVGGDRWLSLAFEFEGAGGMSAGVGVGTRVVGLLPLFG